MLPLVAAVVIVSSLVFARIYGHHLVNAFLESKTPATLPEVNMEALNAQLLTAFGTSVSRELVDCTTYENIEVEYLDSELLLILEDDTLTTSQALAQIAELLNRGVANGAT